MAVARKGVSRSILTTASAGHSIEHTFDSVGQAVPPAEDAGSPAPVPVPGAERRPGAR
jgi:hypothetical protein